LSPLLLLLVCDLYIRRILFFSSSLLPPRIGFLTRDDVFPRRANGYTPRICFLPLIILRIAAFDFPLVFGEEGDRSWVGLVDWLIAWLDLGLEDTRTRV
jgi:hypothetical protein